MRRWDAAAAAEEASREDVLAATSSPRISLNRSALTWTRGLVLRDTSRGMVFARSRAAGRTHLASQETTHAEKTVRAQGVQFAMECSSRVIPWVVAMTSPTPAQQRARGSVGRLVAVSLWCFAVVSCCTYLLEYVHVYHGSYLRCSSTIAIFNS